MKTVCILEARFLHDFSVLAALDVQLGRVRNELGRNKDGSDRACAVEALAEAPLRLGELLSATGDVVGCGVAQDIVESLGFGHVLCFFREHDCQFGFVVGLVEYLGELGNDCRCRVWVSE